jgi:hypothetical protein
MSMVSIQVTDQEVDDIDESDEDMQESEKDEAIINFTSLQSNQTSMMISESENYDWMKALSNPFPSNVSRTPPEKQLEVKVFTNRCS